MMALPMLRGCYCSRPPSVLTRLFNPELVVLTRPSRTRLTPTLSAVSVSAIRSYSSDQGRHKQKQKNLVFISIPNIFLWVRAKMYYFLIRTYFDKEFSIEDFTEGATQAFSHVSRLLSKCQFEALEGLVAEDLIGKLQEKCSHLPSSHKSALSADFDEIMYTTPGDVGIYYDDDGGRKFVSILMRFWYLTSAQLPDDTMKGAGTIQVDIGGDQEAEPKRLLTANYEFQREFTKGVPPEWTITRIEHSKLLD